MNQRLRHLIPWQLWLALGFTVLNLTLMLIIDGWRESGDTWSYIRTADPILQHGYDVHRTIGYPLVFAFFYKILGPGYFYQGVIITQVAVFLFSVGILWHMLKSLTHSTTTATVFTTLYGIVPGIAFYATILNPESFTLSFAIFFAWASLKLLRGKANWLSISVYFISLVALFALRPASMSFLGAAAVLILALFVLRRPGRYIVAAATALSLVGPTFQFVKTTQTLGVPTLTYVSLINRYMSIQQSGLKVHPELAEDPEFGKLINHYMDSIPGLPYTQAYDYIVFHHRAKDLDALLKAEGTPWLGLGARIRIAMCDYYLFQDYTYMTRDTEYSKFMITSMPFVYLRYWLYAVVLVVGAIVGILQWRRDRRVPWFTLFLLATLSAAVATAILYGPDSFDRLTIPGAPAFFLLAALPFGKEYLIPPYNKQENNDI